MEAEIFEASSDRTHTVKEFNVSHSWGLTLQAANHHRREPGQQDRAAGNAGTFAELC